MVRVLSSLTASYHGQLTSGPTKSPFFPLNFSYGKHTSWFENDNNLCSVRAASLSPRVVGIIIISPLMG